MTAQKIRARKKPRFGLPWLAIILALGTVVFAGLGYKAVTEIPSSAVEVVVEGQNPWNISQATVDAAITEPIKAWKPLRILVTDRLLSYDELNGQIDPGANVILSTDIVQETQNIEREERFDGAGIYPADPNSAKSRRNGYAIHRAYTDNLGLGHGPKAVVAAATRAAQVLDSGPVRTPLFWLSGTTVGLLLTILCFAFSLSRRNRRESLYRRLTAAQRQLAGVVLELEALEVTYRATEEEKRTIGFTATWNLINSASLDLARTEGAVIDAVHNPKTSLREESVGLVSRFEIEAKRLVVKAEALLGAGSVLGGLAGGQRVLDRLAGPLTFATRELLARLHAAPLDAVPEGSVQRLESALDALLGTVAKKQETAAVVAEWEQAERELRHSATEICNALRRNRKGRVRGTARGREDLGSLRAGLGLPASGSKQVLQIVDDANASARALFGPLPGSKESGQTPEAQHRWKGWAPLRIRRSGWVFIGVMIAMSSVIVSGAVSEQLIARPAWSLQGDRPLHSLSFDGETRNLDESAIRTRVNDRFTQDLDVVVAVRSAEEYLGSAIDQESFSEDGLREQDPTVLPSALWRLKGEFPHLVDQSTGELRSGQVIIPVWSFDSGAVTIPTIISAEVSLGENPRLVSSTWTYGSYHVARDGEYAITDAIEELARGLQGNGFISPDINGRLLFWLLASSIAMALVVLVQIFIYGGAVSMKLGRFGRNSAALRRVQKGLDSLALGLDESRLNTVAVLGSGSASTNAEADQRIFERALAMAWRMTDDLAARPLSARLGADYVAEIEKLTVLVSTLGIRDAEAQRRTEELMEATLRPATSM